MASRSGSHTRGCPHARQGSVAFHGTDVDFDDECRARVTHSREYPEEALIAIRTVLDAGVAARTVIAQPAFERCRGMEITFDRHHRINFTRRSTAIYMKGVAHLVGECPADERHREIQLPAFR